MWMLVDHPQSTIDMWCDECRSHFGSSHFGSSRFGLRGGRFHAGCAPGLRRHPSPGTAERWPRGRHRSLPAAPRRHLAPGSCTPVPSAGRPLPPPPARPTSPRPSPSPSPAAPGRRRPEPRKGGHGTQSHRALLHRKRRENKKKNRCCDPPCQRSGSGSWRRDHFWSARQVFPSMPRISIAGQSTWASVWLVSWQRFKVILTLTKQSCMLAWQQRMSRRVKSKMQPLKKLRRKTPGGALWEILWTTRSPKDMLANQLWERRMSRAWRWTLPRQQSKAAALQAQTEKSSKQMSQWLCRPVYPPSGGDA